MLREEEPRRTIRTAETRRAPFPRPVFVADVGDGDGNNTSRMYLGRDEPPYVRRETSAVTRTRSRTKEARHRREIRAIRATWNSTSRVSRSRFIVRLVTSQCHPIDDIRPRLKICVCDSRSRDDKISRLIYHSRKRSSSIMRERDGRPPTRQRPRRASRYRFPDETRARSRVYIARQRSGR